MKIVKLCVILVCCVLLSGCGMPSVKNPFKKDGFVGKYFAKNEKKKSVNPFEEKQSQETVKTEELPALPAIPAIPTGESSAKAIPEAAIKK